MIDGIVTIAVGSRAVSPSAVASASGDTVYAYASATSRSSNAPVKDAMSVSGPVSTQATRSRRAYAAYLEQSRE